MRWFILVLIVLATSIACQAQIFPANFGEKKDTAYVSNDSIVGLAKGESINLATSRKIAIRGAVDVIATLLEVDELTLSYKIIDEKTFRKEDGSFIYWIAILIDDTKYLR